MLMRMPESITYGESRDYTDIKRKIEASYNDNQAVWQEFWSEAMLDVALEAGVTDLQTGFQATSTNRSHFYFNHTRPLGLQLKGYYQKNRKTVIAVPGELGDQKTSDLLSKLLLNIFKKENFYATIADAFHQGAFMTGLNLLQIYVDYSRDVVNGDIKLQNLAYNQFFIDPYFRDKVYLTDCGFIWKRTFVNHAEAAALMPEHYERIMSISSNTSVLGARDGKFQWMPESYGQTNKNLLVYDEYYYRDYRTAIMMYDKITGECREWPYEDEVDLKVWLYDNPQVEAIEQRITTIRLCILINDEVFFDGPSGWDEYPFVPVIGFYNSMMPYFYNRIQGICRSLRDVQALLNRRINLNSDYAESALNTGWIFKEDAVIDVNHLFQTGAGRVIPLKKSAQMTDIQQVPPPQIPPSFFQLQDTYLNEFPLVSGITTELMGNADNDKSGYRTRLLQGAGLTTLQPLFSALDDAVVRLGDIIIDTAMRNYTPGKFKAIFEGEDPTPYFYQENFAKYHCQVQLGYDTESQMQMQLIQLQQLREGGVQIPDSVIINAAPIQNKTEVLKQMEQEKQQAMQMQQMQSQLQMEQIKAQIANLNAQSKANIGLGNERDSRVYENYALQRERDAQAIKDREQAIAQHHRDEEASLLNFIQVYKEIQGMDINNLREVIGIARDIEDQRRASTERDLQQPMGATA